MTRAEVIQKALDGCISWQQAADICGMTARHMRRLRERYGASGIEGLRDRRAGREGKTLMTAEQIEALCRLRREQYPDFSVRHFYQFACERHGLKMGYTWTKNVLQARGLAPRATARGKHRRRRERRPMRGMLLHLDASTHTWIPGQPQWDLMVVLDDADGRMLYARFVEEEGTMETLAALHHVLVRWGRFAQLYTDRASHFCRTTDAKAGPDEVQNGQVARALKVLGIGQILARSPEARGRSERAFGTIQGRLPQELRLADIQDYEAANAYLDSHFVADFNRRFTVEPTQPDSAFVPLAGVQLELLMSVQHERVVGNDNTVSFERMTLQLPRSRDRCHFVRCPVLVHRFTDDTLGISYQGRLLARYHADGQPRRLLQRDKRAA